MKFRSAEDNDVKLVYDWANDPVTRSQSFNSEPIPYDKHVVWFRSKLKDKSHLMLIFIDDTNLPTGMVRFDHEENHVVIGVNVAPNQRGKGYAALMLFSAVSHFRKKGILPIYAYIKEDNIASIKSFARAGFQLEKHLLYNNINSVLYIWK